MSGCRVGVVIRHHADGTHVARCEACGEASKTTQNLPAVQQWADIHKRTV